jgi:hypothetical protein
MMRSSCHEVADLIGSDSAQLNEAARLRLEHHLEECADCRQDLALARSARDLFPQSSPVLQESSRERALSRALARAAAGNVVSQRARPRGLVYGTAFVSAAAAALLLWTGRGESPRVAAPKVASAPVSARAPEGALRQTEAREQTKLVERGSLADSESDAWIDVSSAQVMHFAHARVEVAGNSRLKFDRAGSVLSLERGRVDLDVDPSAGKVFWVHTQTFRVQVLGTQFSVTPEQVSVREGHVQVSDHQGKVLARDLAGGTTFSLQHGPETRTAPASATAAQTTAARASLPEPAIALDRARKFLANGQTQLAAQLLDGLKRAHLSRQERAEASTLRAEIALLEHNLGGALKQYEVLGRRFGDLPAGENATFAAAQLAARTAPARERALLESYLAHYPKGRFADEARAKLRKLAAP